MAGKDRTSAASAVVSLAPGRRYDRGMQTTGGIRPDAELARIVIANWEALESAIAVRFGGAAESTERVFRFRSGLHSGFLNGVLRATVAADSVHDLAGEMRGWFPPELPWRWIVGPGSAPDDLADRLSAEGFERRWPHMPTMTVGLDAFDPGRWALEDGRVTEVLAPADLEDWLSVRRVNLALDDRTIAAWRRTHGEMGVGPASPLRHFVGWLGDRPLAACTLFLDRATGTAGIYHVDVLADARGRGFGKSVTAAALAAARELGYPLGVLSASTLGTPVYLRLGFRIVGGVAVFVGGGH
jgi:GNAT superfamily N-acetyltransferase